MTEFGSMLGTYHTALRVRGKTWGCPLRCRRGSWSILGRADRQQWKRQHTLSGSLIPNFHCAGSPLPSEAPTAWPRCRLGHGWCVRWWAERGTAGSSPGSTAWLVYPEALRPAVGLRRGGGQFSWLGGCGGLAPSPRCRPPRTGWSRWSRSLMYGRWERGSPHPQTPRCCLEPPQRQVESRGGTQFGWTHEWKSRRETQQRWSYAKHHKANVWTHPTDFMGFLSCSRVFKL